MSKLWNKLQIKLNNIDKFHIMLLMIMLFSAFFLLYLTTLKEGMHLDEYLTYGLANQNAEGVNKIKPEYGVRLNAADVFDSYFYTDSFSLKNIWLNQGNDVHPPLYYLCIHIITLLTNHFMALKTGILVNIIFHLVNIYLIWLILKEAIHNKYTAILGSLLYAFLPKALGNVLFVRMYVMLTVFILCLILLFVKRVSMLDKPSDKVFYIKLAIISVAGTLTHYYFLIYLFFCCMIWGIYILIKRRWKELAVFLATMAASAGISIAIFPYMLQHIFVGYRGEESFKNLLSASVFIKNFQTYWKALDEVYGGFLLAIIVAAVLNVLFAGYLLMEKRTKRNGGNTLKWIMLLIPPSLYVLTIARISSITSSRYIAPAYAVCIILLMILADNIVSYMSDKKLKCIVLMLMVCILFNSCYKIYTWPELHLEAGDYVNKARKYGVNNDCIYVMSLSWHSYMSYQEFIQYQSMTFIRDNNLEMLYTEDYSNYDHVVMYFDKNVGQENIDKILTKIIEMNAGLNEYEYLHEYGYNVAYYLE